VAPLAGLEEASAEPYHGLVSERPREARSRNVDPFDAPDDYGDVWRGRRLGIVLVGLGIIVLIVVLFLFL
jgi:hypothetical protein